MESDETTKKQIKPSKIIREPGKKPVFVYRGISPAEFLSQLPQDSKENRRVRIYSKPKADEKHNLPAARNILHAKDNSGSD